MSPILLFFVTISPCREWVICVPAAFLGCGRYKILQYFPRWPLWLNLLLTVGTDQLTMTSSTDRCCCDCSWFAPTPSDTARTRSSASVTSEGKLSVLLRSSARRHHLVMMAFHLSTNSHNKKLNYRRRTARCVVLTEILPIATNSAGTTCTTSPEPSISCR